MTSSNYSLEERIDAMNQLSLVAYLKLLGYTPTYTNEEFTLFDIPLYNAASSTLVVKHSTNRFRLTMSISHRGILDIASLLFRAKPEEILANTAAFKLNQLMSADFSEHKKPS